MDLKHIKETSCPICGCNIVKNEEVEMEQYTDRLKVRQHCNGQQWEHRIFACGQRISWIPNFSKSELSDYHVCTKNQKYIEQKQKREVSKQQVMQFIETLEDVDQDFKNKMLFEIKTIYI